MDIILSLVLTVKSRRKKNSHILYTLHFKSALHGDYIGGFDHLWELALNVPSNAVIVLSC